MTTPLKKRTVLPPRREGREDFLSKDVEKIDDRTFLVQDF
jgi:hypothetical protein